MTKFFKVLYHVCLISVAVGSLCLAVLAWEDARRAKNMAWDSVGEAYVEQAIQDAFVEFDTELTDELVSRRGFMLKQIEDAKAELRAALPSHDARRLELASVLERAARDIKMETQASITAR